MFGWLQSLFDGASLELDPGSLADFQRQTMALAAATGQSGGDVLREQTRLLVKDLVATTPPFGRAAHLQDIDKQYFIGKAAVRRDVRRVFRPVTTLRAWTRPTNRRVKRSLERAVRQGDTLAVARIMRFNPGRVIARAEPRLHQSARDGKGTVPADFRWYVVLDEGSVREYEQEMFERIGRAKAGWETAARAVGVELPEWIERHASPGRFRQVNGPDGPSIEIANDVAYGSDFDELHILEKALARREQAMGQELEKALGATFSGF